MRKPTRFLPAAVFIGFLGFAFYSVQGSLENGLPKDLFFGCYAHPEHGRFDVTADNISYDGHSFYEKWSGTKVSGPPQLVGNPHFSRTVREGGGLDFRLIKSGMNARDIYNFTDGPAGQRALLVRTANTDDLTFSEVPCTP